MEVLSILLEDLGGMPTGYRLKKCGTAFIVPQYRILDHVVVQ